MHRNRAPPTHQTLNHEFYVHKKDPPKILQTSSSVPDILHRQLI